MSEQTIGRYVIEEVIGQGAMGKVYKALDPLLDRHAAIKVMSSGDMRDSDLRARFFREARSAAKLNHPGIVSIYDVGEDSEGPFIAMEFVEGCDLKDLIRNRTFSPFTDKLALIRAVCESLQYAHEKGIVHRDIKPGNIRITPAGDVKILDFGIARMASSEMTRTGEAIGTPYYMSPEQIMASRQIDGRSDLFSVTVVLYEFLTYHRPFESETPTATCFRIVSQPHTPIREIFPACAPELIEILDRALAKDPNDRFLTCAEFAERLSAFEEKVHEHVPALQEQIESLRGELRELSNQAAREAVPGYFEESLFPSVLLKPAREEDYGSLLHTHSELFQKTELFRERVRQVPRLLEALSRARDSVAAEDWENAMGFIEEVLEEHPENEEALHLRSQCDQALEELNRAESHRKKLDRALEAARRALKKKDFGDCLKAARQALSLDPKQAEAVRLAETADRTLQLEELLSRTLDLQESGDPKECLELARRGLRLEPSHPTLLEVSRWAEEKLNRRREKLSRLMTEAEEAASREDFERVVEACDKLLAISPENGGARDLRRHAMHKNREKQRALELFKAAETFHRCGEIEPCMRATLVGLELLPQHPGLQQLRMEATQKFDRSGRLDALLDQARGRLKKDDLPSAYELASQAAFLAPDNADAQMVLEQTQTSLNRRVHVQALLTQAGQSLKEHRLDDSERSLQDVIALEPGNSEVRKLKRRLKMARLKAALARISRHGS